MICNLDIFNCVRLCKFLLCFFGKLSNVIKIIGFFCLKFGRINRSSADFEIRLNNEINNGNLEKDLNVQNYVELYSATREKFRDIKTSLNKMLGDFIPILSFSLTIENVEFSTYRIILIVDVDLSRINENEITSNFTDTTVILKKQKQCKIEEIKTFNYNYY